LLELLIAIVLASVVALLVYGTAAVGTDTQERVLAARRNIATQNAFRATLVDALRNARAASYRGETVLTLEDRVDASGRPADRLSFVTAGGGPPLTSDTEWAVTLEPTGSGVQMVARAVGVVRAPAVVVNLPGAVGLDVRVLTPGPFGEWEESWGMYDPLPGAAGLTFWVHQGATAEDIVVTIPSGVGQ
jgi:type II secretory pathway pseudopilin PulG